MKNTAMKVFLLAGALLPTCALGGVCEDTVDHIVWLNDMFRPAEIMEVHPCGPETDPQIGSVRRKTDACLVRYKTWWGSVDSASDQWYMYNDPGNEVRTVMKVEGDMPYTGFSTHEEHLFYLIFNYANMVKRDNGFYVTVSREKERGWPIGPRGVKLKFGIQCGR